MRCWICGLEGWCAASPLKCRGAFDEVNEICRDETSRQFNRQEKQGRCRRKEQATMRNSLAIRTIERAAIRWRLVIRGGARVYLDDCGPVRKPWNAVDMGLREKGLQREGNSNQQRHKISR